MESHNCDFSTIEGILSGFLLLIEEEGATRAGVLDLILDNLPTTGSFIRRNVALSLLVTPDHPENGMFIDSWRKHLEGLQTRKTDVQAG